MTLWNGQWYGGHYTLGYSVVFPPLAAWFGPVLVGVVSCVAATTCLCCCFGSATERRGALVAASWFAVGMAVNLAVGRLPFALGLAFGLLALLAYQRATPCQQWSPLCSPHSPARLRVSSSRSGSGAWSSTCGCVDGRARTWRSASRWTGCGQRRAGGDHIGSVPRSRRVSVPGRGIRGSAGVLRRHCGPSAHGRAVCALPLHSQRQRRCRCS